MLDFNCRNSSCSVNSMTQRGKVLRVGFQVKQRFGFGNDYMISAQKVLF